ncbi:MAG: DUF362 domain-containing protein [Planctomycetaceae bacterium]
MTRIALAGVHARPTETELKQAVRDAVLAVTDFSWLKSGETVFIKPSLNSGHPYPATTSPIALAAMIELLKEKGAGRCLLGDMAGIEYVKLSPDECRGSTRQLMDNAGMTQPVLEAGAELHFFEEAGWDAFYEDFPTAGEHWRGPLMMPEILRQVNHIVLMPRCGHHVLLGSTLGLKAAVGYWRTDTRLEYHYGAATIHEKTAEANTVSVLLEKQRLVVTAADKILATFGPDQGHVVEPETGLVIASKSVVAHDMVSLAWLLEHRHTVAPELVEGFIDTSPLVAEIGNRWVVGKLGSPPSALTAEHLRKQELQTIWDDRVLNQAYRIFGGIPDLQFVSANQAVPQELVQRIEKTTMPEHR